MLIFNLWHKKKIRRYKTLIHILTKRIEDKTNDNNNNNNKNNNIIITTTNNSNNNNNNNKTKRKTKNIK